MALREEVMQGCSVKESCMAVCEGVTHGCM